MKLVDVIQILTNKISNLKNQRDQAVTAGDLATVELVDESIIETELTLNQLKEIQE